jgi:hypothetical protein
VSYLSASGRKLDEPARARIPFDVTLPEGFDLGAHRSALEAAAEQAGWMASFTAAATPSRILALRRSP